MANLPISDYYRAGQVGKRMLNRALAGIYREQGDAIRRRGASTDVAPATASTVTATCILLES